MKTSSVFPIAMLMTGCAAQVAPAPSTTTTTTISDQGETVTHDVRRPVAVAPVDDPTFDYACTPVGLDPVTSTWQTPPCKEEIVPGSWGVSCQMPDQTVWWYQGIETFHLSAEKDANGYSRSICHLWGLMVIDRFADTVTIGGGK